MTIAHRNGSRKFRLAFVVSHPIQYYTPLYVQLSARPELDVKVFFTWHRGAEPVRDDGFNRPVAWDIPLTDGYESELLRNSAARPGTGSFFGIRNPEIVERIRAWRPDAVHVTGYGMESHLRCILQLPRHNIPVLFRGDSHLLGQSTKPGRRARRMLRRFVFRRPELFLYVGKHNREYYRDAGVPEHKLVYCPHSIDVQRFSEPNDRLEREAASWRNELGIPEGAKVVLYAGKFLPRKRPLELMRAIAGLGDDRVHLIMAGDGQLADQVREIARQHPRMLTLSFENQTRMPVLYRLADVFCLSSDSESWGLGVTEAVACGRRVVVSTRVGCAPDVVRPGFNGEVFVWNDWSDFQSKLRSVLTDSRAESRESIRQDATRFATEEAASAVLSSLQRFPLRA